MKAKHPKSKNTKAMYIINAIAIIMFLAGIIYKVFIDK